MDRTTRQTLHRALAEEAEEMVRYLLYAELARSEGHDEIAATFEAAARLSALEHAREQLLLLGEVGTTAQNLCRAIATETADTRVFYPDLAREAADAGEMGTAVFLRDVAAEKADLLDQFRSAYAQLRVTQSATMPEAPAVVGS